MNKIIILLYILPFVKGDLKETLLFILAHTRANKYSVKNKTFKFVGFQQLRQSWSITQFSRQIAATEQQSLNSIPLSSRTAMAPSNNSTGSGSDTDICGTQCIQTSFAIIERCLLWIQRKPVLTMMSGSST